MPLLIHFSLLLITLNYALCIHCIYDLFKARNVRTDYVIALEAILLCGIVNVVIQTNHNALELTVYLFKTPRQAFAILRHFKCRCCNTARICRLHVGNGVITAERM